MASPHGSSNLSTHSMTPPPGLVDQDGLPPPLRGVDGGGRRPPSRHAFASGASTPSSSLSFLKLSMENATSSREQSYALQAPVDQGRLSGLRRGRAETMPSQTLPPFLGNVERTSSSSSLNLAMQQPHQTPYSMHSASMSAGNLFAGSMNANRTRSGSLTLPTANIDGAFGPSLFNTPWNDERKAPPRRVSPPQQVDKDPLLEDEPSKNIVRTLVSLGLDDVDRQPEPTSNGYNYSSTLPSQHASSTLAHLNIPLTSNPNRFRSYSLSAKAKYPNTPPDSGIITPAETEYPHTEVHIGSRPVGLYDDLHHHDEHPQRLRIPSLHQNRPRAISMGVLNPLDDNNAFIPPALRKSLRENLGVGSSLREELIFDQDYGQETNYEVDAGRGASDNLNTSSSLPLRESSPANNAVSIQIPNRTLWIGNLDASIREDVLFKLFSQFGPIESIRVIEEKECAFVNFINMADAIKAKEELLGPMEGRIGAFAVRVGFGKAENGATETPLQKMSDEISSSLYIGNLPANTSPDYLYSVFQSFGPITSSRVVAAKNCGFIDFEHLSDAVTARKAMNGVEAFGPGSGKLKVGFAKVRPSNRDHAEDHDIAGMRYAHSPGSGKRFPSASVVGSSNPYDMYQNNMMMMMMAQGGYHQRMMILQEFGTSENDGPALDENRTPVRYFNFVPSIPKPNPNRTLDAIRLRDMRKRLENMHTTSKEVEAIAQECMDECVELSSDYIGNTVIQKLFERASEATKLKMLESIAPYLAAIGIHKNGTWAAQKIIDTAKTPAQFSLITNHLKAYTPPLLLDQFGNYVVQCCLRLGTHYNQFIFDAVVECLWDIAQGRFGARSIRAALENQHVTRAQQKYVAAAIVQHSLLLASDANGNLLLTWFLETSGLPGRYRLLSQRFAPQIIQLATHKVAGSTVLKLILQHEDKDAQATILQALFYSGNERILAEVVFDHVQGVPFLQKVITSPCVDLYDKYQMAQLIQSTMVRLKVDQMPAWARLSEQLNSILSDPLAKEAQPTPKSTYPIPDARQYPVMMPMYTYYPYMYMMDAKD
ncbi:hypothetical protein BZG36_03928 [Bifiguratus adelaidae]|uniref:PUM-HD domain-containing protein n=1 Tax=Bifiguratus adelaidae TaxID=1938954 RepID=A0A261XZ50_9FUNG|nr:hypothetical protein BZG36_03928 [Bifiguratus adelaidae]